MVQYTPPDKKRRDAHPSHAKGIGKAKTQPLLTAAIGASLPTSECQDTSVQSFAPQFLHAYVQHFEDFQKKLRTFQNLDEFCLLPIEVPSRDVGRALIRYLDQHGSGVLLVEPRSWPTLVAQVLALPGRDQDPRPVVIFGPRDWLEELPRALNYLNLQRDTIGQLLQRPLIWCGLRFFMEAMWDHAPDFWSIRDVTTQIPLESEPHVPLRTILDPFAQPMVLLAKPNARKFPVLRALARALLDHVRSLLVHGRANNAFKPLRDAAKILLHEKKQRTTVEDVLYRELDADVAFALENDSLAECAYPLALQGHRDTGDVHGQARVLAKLARTAKRRHDPLKAVGQFDEALRLVDELGDLSLRASILQARGSDPQSPEQTRAARVDVDEAIKLFESIGEDSGLARALVTRSFLRYDLADYEGAKADLDRIMPTLLPQTDPIAWTNAQMLRGVLYCQEKAYNKAENFFDSLLHQTGYARNPSIRAWTLIQCGKTLGYLGSNDDAEKKLTKALELLGSEGLSSWRADAYLWRSNVRHQLQKWVLAEHDAKLARDLSNKTNDSGTNRLFHWSPDYYFHQWHAHTLTHTGNLDRARPEMDEALEQAAGESIDVRARLWSERANIRAKMGDFDGAWNDFEQCLVLQQENGSEKAEADTRILRVSTWLSTFDVPQDWFERLRSDLDRVINELSPRVSPEFLAQAHFLRGKLYGLQEMPEQARVDLDTAIAGYEALDKHNEMLQALSLRFDVHGALEDGAGAQKDLDQMVLVAEKHNDATTAFYHGLAKAMLAEKSGDVEQALRILRQVRDDRHSSDNLRSLAEALMAQMHHRHGHQRSALKLAKRALERSQGQPWHFGIEACVKDINDSSTDGQD